MGTKQLNQLLADAKCSPPPFDAVMVAHPDRWSRDNTASEAGLKRLQENNIRFYILGQEQDLFDPTVRLYLALSATIGSYQAGVQTKKSLENRIERAKRGWPACGKKPLGRTFDRQSGEWSIVEEKQTMIQEVASRYLAGESMARLAAEYGVNHPYLHKTLTQGCGPIWEQRFSSSKYRIEETVRTPVPPLLDPEVIAAIRAKAAANKTFSHGSIKYEYLLARMVFCERCGYAMSGERGPKGKRYYRHQSRNGAACCSLPIRPWVPAEMLEQELLAKLADLWGNPTAIEKALREAEPEKAEVDKARKQLERIQAELAKVKDGRDNSWIHCQGHHYGRPSGAAIENHQRTRDRFGR